MSTAIYPLSADPITYGHIDIIKRASKLFDRVIIAIGVNESKKALFSLKERELMALRVIKGIPNVELVTFEGMLVDFAYRKTISTVIRGARNSSDFDYEKLLSDINQYQNANIDTCVLFTKPDKSHISSSAVKALVVNSGRDINKYVPCFVKQKLEEKLLGQYRVGVTGLIASGKSYLMDSFRDEKDVHLIYTDSIAKYILEYSEEPRDVEVRKNLVSIFGNDISDESKEGFINITALKHIIFKSLMDLVKYQIEIKEAVDQELRHRLFGLKGLILIEAANLDNNDFLDHVNNNVIVVKQQTDIRKNRLIDNRGYSPEMADSIINMQPTEDNLLRYINNYITNANSGKIFDYSTYYKLTVELSKYFNIPL